MDLSQVTKRYSVHRTQIDQQFIKQYGGAVFLQLVETEQKFIPAFWHVMGDTVVCDNSENALAINRNNNRQQRNRVVTQDGELYERGGSLTGGGVSELLHRFKGFTYDAYT